MSEKYKNKYRIASARAQWWNYGWNGAYFVTICTENRACFFGEINGGKICLSRTGVVADIIWHQIPHHAPFVALGDFVVMPNHIHGILIFDKPDIVAQPVDTPPLPEPPSPKNQRMATISPRAQTLSTVVRSYKSAVTRHANRLGLEYGWQARFHDRIIRNDAEYQRISDYIRGYSDKFLRLVSTRASG